MSIDNDAAPEPQAFAEKDAHRIPAEPEMSDVSDVEEQELDVSSLLPANLAAAPLELAPQSDETRETIAKLFEDSDSSVGAPSQGDAESNASDEEAEYNRWVEQKDQERQQQTKASKKELLELHKESERLVRETRADMPMRWTGSLTIKNLLRKKGLVAAAGPEEEQSPAEAGWPTLEPAVATPASPARLKPTVAATGKDSLANIERERKLIVERIKRRQQQKLEQTGEYLGTAAADAASSSDDEDLVVVDMQAADAEAALPMWKRLRLEQQPKKGVASGAGNPSNFVPLHQRNRQLQLLAAQQTRERREREDSYVAALMQSGKRRQRPIAKRLEAIVAAAPTEKQPASDPDNLGDITTTMGTIEDPAQVHACLPGDEDDSSSDCGPGSVTGEDLEHVLRHSRQPSAAGGVLAPEIPDDGAISESTVSDDDAFRLPTGPRPVAEDSATAPPAQFGFNAQFGNSQAVEPGPTQDIGEWFVATNPSMSGSAGNVTQTGQSARTVLSNGESIPSSVPAQPAGPPAKGTLAYFFQGNRAKPAETVVTEDVPKALADAPEAPEREITPEEPEESPTSRSPTPKPDHEETLDAETVTIAPEPRRKRNRFCEDEAEEEDEDFGVRAPQSDDEDEQMDVQELLELQRMIVADREGEARGDGGENAELFRQRMADEDAKIVQQLLEDVTLGNLLKKRRGNGGGASAGRTSKGFDIASDDNASDDEDALLQQAQQWAMGDVWRIRDQAERAKRRRAAAARESGASEQLAKYASNARTRAFADAFAVDKSQEGFISEASESSSDDDEAAFSRGAEHQAEASRPAQRQYGLGQKRRDGDHSSGLSSASESEVDEYDQDDGFVVGDNADELEFDSEPEGDRAGDLDEAAGLSQRNVVEGRRRRPTGKQRGTVASLLQARALGEQSEDEDCGALSVALSIEENIAPEPSETASFAEDSSKSPAADIKVLIRNRYRQPAAVGVPSASTDLDETDFVGGMVGAETMVHRSSVLHRARAARHGALQAAAKARAAEKAESSVKQPTKPLMQTLAWDQPDV